jgi:hypothetical protein
MAHPRLALTWAVVATLGCQAKTVETPASSTPELARAAEPSEALRTRELALRYRLGIDTFDRGAYEDAAALFAQLLLEVPQDPSGDDLRHLLVQHIGWSLLGAYDMRGDPGWLDEGEQMLERYLAKHEALLPDANAQREDIYELLGEYQDRRAGQPPASANARLVALVETTKSGFEQQLALGRQRAYDDGPVRVIEVETIPWAKLGDRRTRKFFAADGSSLGAWLRPEPDPLHPTRVLVRGRVLTPGLGDATHKHARELVKAARPELERCYERALVRGADLLERVNLELVWHAGSLAELELGGVHGLDGEDSTCVREAMLAADQQVESRSGESRARLGLTFFVQFEAPGPGGGGDSIDAYPLDSDFDPTSPM